MRKNTKLLKDILGRSFILGGSPCSGKSTIAKRLAAQHDLAYYKVDDHDRAHMARIDPARHPTMHAFVQMNWNEVWSRPVALQVAEELAFYHERFEMILEDLEVLDRERPVLLEGAALLPELIHQWGVKLNRALYLIPTKAFQVRHYSQRPWIKDILRECDDPEQAFDNWMERDHQFGQEIINQLCLFRYEYIVIDGNKVIDEITRVVRNHFRLR